MARRLAFALICSMVFTNLATAADELDQHLISASRTWQELSRETFAKEVAIGYHGLITIQAQDEQKFVVSFPSHQLQSHMKRVFIADVGVALHVIKEIFAQALNKAKPKERGEILANFATILRGVSAALQNLYDGGIVAAPIVFELGEWLELVAQQLPETKKSTAALNGEVRILAAHTLNFAKVMQPFAATSRLRFQGKFLTVLAALDSKIPAHPELAIYLQEIFIDYMEAAGLQALGLEGEVTKLWGKTVLRYKDLALKSPVMCSRLNDGAKHPMLWSAVSAKLHSN